MSEFGNFLKNQTISQRVSAREMASSMGVNSSHLSAMIKGRRTSCNVETLMKIVLGISPGVHVQAGALQSYFRDQVIAHFKQWIKVHPDSGHPGPDLVEEEAVSYHGTSPIDQLSQTLRDLQLPHDTVLAFLHIARFIPGRHPFRAVIEDLGKFAQDELSVD